TNASGVTTGTVRSTLAGIFTVTATVSPTTGGTVVLTTQPMVEFIADASMVGAGTSSVDASPAAAIAGSTGSTLTVTVKDVNGNLLSGSLVQFGSSGTGVTFTPASAPTDGSGVATSVLTSTTAGLKTVTATASGVLITDTASVTFNGNAATIS